MQPVRLKNGDIRYPSSVLLDGGGGIADVMLVAKKGTPEWKTWDLVLTERARL